MKANMHEFKDTGVTVELQKVSPFVITDVRALAQQSRPKPPTRIVEEDGPLQGTVEVMQTDPQYIETLRQWERKANELVMRMQIRLGVKSVIDPVNWKEKVEEYRFQRELMIEELKAFKADYNPEPLPEDDLTIFILFVACGSTEDVKEFTEEITRRSYPTGETLEAARDSFRPNI